MFVAPGTLPDITHKFTREAAERVASNWWKVLLNGMLLIVAGVLIFSIDWSVRSLATFIGALFIAEGVAMSLTAGIDKRVSRANIVSGLLSIAVSRIVMSFELKRLPHDVDQAYAQATNGSTSAAGHPEHEGLAAARS